MLSKKSGMITMTYKLSANRYVIQFNHNSNCNVLLVNLPVPDKYRNIHT